MNGKNVNISYVTVMELPERKNYFKKNGIVLSTFQAFESTEVIIDQIDWLQKQGIVAIGFHELYHKVIPRFLKLKRLICDIKMKKEETWKLES